MFDSDDDGFDKWDHLWNYIDENGVFHSGESMDDSMWDAASEGKGTLLMTPKNKAHTHWCWRKCVALVQGMQKRWQRQRQRSRKLKAGSRGGGDLDAQICISYEVAHSCFPHAGA